MFTVISELPEPVPSDAPTGVTLYELPEEEIPFTISKVQPGIYRVSGARIERAAQMTHWDFEDAVLRFQNILETLGVSAALEKAGVKVGDTVFIGEFELEWTD